MKLGSTDSSEIVIPAPDKDRLPSLVVKQRYRKPRTTVRFCGEAHSKVHTSKEGYNNAMQNYSRLSKFQQRKVLMQSLVLLFFSIAFLVLFIFIILPLTARIVELIPSKTSTPLTNVNNGIPPQTPVLLPILSATNSAQLSVSGYGEAETTLTLYNNGTRVQEVKPTIDGKFSFTDFTISDGENEIIVSSRNSAKTESLSTPHKITLDTTPPTLTIQQPADGSIVTIKRDQVISIKGQTDPKTKVFLNDKFLFIDALGNFTGTFQLTEGDNTLNFHLSDEAGNVTDKSIKVSFKP